MAVRGAVQSSPGLLQELMPAADLGCLETEDRDEDFLNGPK
jgi:hypothetical protein